MTDLTFLHGFSQDKSVLDRFRAELPAHWECEAPTLPGHASGPEELPTSPDHFAKLTLERLRPASASPKRILVGYSLGGRLAIDLALRCPDRWTDLVVVSAGAGLEGEIARAKRRESDESIASLLENDGILAFSNLWDAQKIWAGGLPESAEVRREMISTKTASGLASAIRAYGQGSAPALWKQLNELTTKCLVVTGERDIRYQQTTTRLASVLPSCPKPVTVEAGHSVPLEAPTELATAIVTQSLSGR